MRREWLYYTFFSAIGLCVLLALAGMIWAAYPRPEVVSLGPLSQFPPQSPPYAPYVVRTDKATLYIINIGTDLIVLDGRSTTENRCNVKWVPTNDRYEDPCCGSKFTLEGVYITGRATRDLDRYGYTIKNDEVWTSYPTLG